MARTVLEQMPVAAWGQRMLDVADESVFFESSLSLVRAGTQADAERLLERHTTCLAGSRDVMLAPNILRQMSIRLQVLQEIALRFPELVRQAAGPAEFVGQWLQADLQRCAAESHCFAAGEQSLTLQYRLVAAAAELGVPLAAQGLRPQPACSDCCKVSGSRISWPRCWDYATSWAWPVPNWCSNTSIR